MRWLGRGPVQLVAAVSALFIGVTGFQAPTGAAPVLSSHLISLNQLPLGWTVNNADPSTERQQGFGLAFLKSFIQKGEGGITGTASGVFDVSGLPPEFTEVLAADGQASADAKTLDKALVKSHQSKSKAATASWFPMSFPTLGSAGEAFLMRLGIPAVGGGFANETVYFYVGASGSTLVGLVESGSTSKAPSLNEFARLAKLAIAKV